MNADSQGPERRRHRRHPFRYLLDFRIRFRSPNAVKFQTSEHGNISFGGALLASKTAFPIGESVDVELSGNRNKNRELEVILVLKSTIVWVDEQATADGLTQYQIGVQFDDLTNDKEAILRAFIYEYIISKEDIQEKWDGVKKD